jgi:4-hydroxybenzoate polyprenyltransferase
LTPKTAVRLTRPFTLLPPLLGILSGAVCAFGSAKNPDASHRVTGSLVGFAILASAAAALLNGANNTLNQLTDLEVDRINKPERPLVTGEAKAGEAWRLTWLLYVLALVPTWFIVVPPWRGAAAHQCFWLFLAGFVSTLVYSLPELGRTKARGLLANLTIAIPRGCLLKVAGWTIVAPAASLEPWVIGGLFGLFIFGASSTKDFSDAEGDRAGGCRTLPVVYGTRKAVAIIAPFFVLPWLLLPFLAYAHDPAHPTERLLTGNAPLLAALGVLLALWGAYTVWLLARNPDELATTENHPSWTHMYLMMMAAQVGFALAYVF